MSPIALPLAAIVVMLWLIWSDSLRRRRLAPLFYIARAFLFLIAGGVLLYNVINYPAAYPGETRLLAYSAVLVSVVGIAYFVRRATTRA